MVLIGIFNMSHVHVSCILKPANIYRQQLEFCVRMEVNKEFHWGVVDLTLAPNFPAIRVVRPTLLGEPV